MNHGPNVGVTMRIKANGQVTIPKAIRDAGRYREYFPTLELITP